MSNPPEEVCLIVPCYNEAKRLDFEAFAGCGSNCRFLFVNDGSSDRTAEVVRKNLREGDYLLDLKTNAGKAEAVRQGALYLKTLPVFDRIGWFGYWDADLATPISEIGNLFRYAQTFYPDADAVLGSRVIRLGSRIRRTFRRYFFGRLFANAASLLLKLDIYDSQCGAKIFRKELLDDAFGRPFVSKWIFDVEIILRLRGRKLVEYPLKEWRDQAGGHLSVFSVALRTLVDLIRLRRKYLRKGT